MKRTLSVLVVLVFSFVFVNSSQAANDYWYYAVEADFNQGGANYNVDLRIVAVQDGVATEYVESLTCQFHGDAHINDGLQLDGNGDSVSCEVPALLPILDSDMGWTTTQADMRDSVLMVGATVDSNGTDGAWQNIISGMDGDFLFQLKTGNGSDSQMNMAFDSINPAASAIFGLGHDKDLRGDVDNEVCDDPPCNYEYGAGNRTFSQGTVNGSFTPSNLSTSNTIEFGVNFDGTIFDAIADPGQCFPGSC